MEIIGILIICLFICCLVGYICYSTGHNKKVKEVQYNNKLKENEYNQLISAIQYKQQEISRLNQEYEQKKKVIDDTSNIAQREYNLREQALEEKFKIKEEQLISKYDSHYAELQERYKKHKEIYENDIKEIAAQLDHISQTKAATIEALQQEELVKSERDNYRLNIGRNELNDVEILESIRPRLNKPRVLSMLIWQTYWQPLAKNKFPLILGNKTVCGIYKITNLNDDKVYIGQAKDIRKRWMDHCKCGLGIDTPQGNKLYQAMQDEGLENFTFELLLECEPEQLDKNEQFYIEMFNSIDYGYNGRKQL